MKPRSLVIRREEAGQPVLAVLRGRFRMPSSQARFLVREGKVRLAGNTCRDPSRLVRAGQRLELAGTLQQNRAGRNPGKPPPRSSKQNPAADKIRLVYLDDTIVVVDKPAGLTTVRHKEEVAAFGDRGRKFLPPTLVDLLPDVLAGRLKDKPGRIRAVHRLDRETSGLVVLARTSEAERNLGLQFRDHSIERKYLALVRGRAKTQTIVSNLVADRGDGRRGTGPKGQGQRAVTHVRVLEELGDCTLVECRLETGRTHQVRIHLGESGTPLCGERVYDRPRHGSPVPDPTRAPRPMLHGAFLQIDHPATGKRVSWHAAKPEDFRRLLENLKMGR